jgi:hypothetical protein
MEANLAVTIRAILLRLLNNKSDILQFKFE